MPDSLGGILTNGLGGDCSAMILGPFRLKLKIRVEDIVTPGGPGGVAPPPPGIIPSIDRAEEERIRKKKVYLSIKWGDYLVERDYIVTVERSKMIINVVKWVNKTLDTIRISVNNFRKVVKKIRIDLIEK